MHVTWRLSGFSLVEAVVAVAVLALSCVTVSSVLALSLRAATRDAQTREAAAVLDRECARLQTLPFYRPAGGPGQEPSSLLAEVFPHACSWLNTAGAAYQDDTSDAAAGDFVTLIELSGLHVRCTAWFVRATDGAVEPLAPAEVQGWTVWGLQPPPAAALSVCLEATRGKLRATRRLLLYGVRPSAAASPVSWGGGLHVA